MRRSKETDRVRDKQNGMQRWNFETEMHLLILDWMELNWIKLRWEEIEIWLKRTNPLALIHFLLYQDLNRFLLKPSFQRCMRGVLDFFFISHRRRRNNNPFFACSMLINFKFLIKIKSDGKNVENKLVSTLANQNVALNFVHSFREHIHHTPDCG